MLTIPDFDLSLNIYDIFVDRIDKYIEISI